MKTRSAHFQVQQIAFSLFLITAINLPVFSAPQEKTSESKNTESKSSETATKTEATKSEKSGAKVATQKNSKLENYPNDVLGDWVSEWGPVTFKKDADGAISGQWLEGKNKTGKVDHGKFNDKSGDFEFDLLETWTNLKGHAKLKLSANHNELSGNWTREKKGSKDVDKGTWSMKRPQKK